MCGWILLGLVGADADTDANPKSDPCADRIEPLHMARFSRTLVDGSGPSRLHLRSGSRETAPIPFTIFRT